MIVSRALRESSGVDTAVQPGATQPRAMTPTKRPCLSTEASLKSSMLRQALLPPCSQTQPICTGWSGVASARPQWAPAS